MTKQNIKIIKDLQSNLDYSICAILQTKDNYIILGDRKNSFALYPHLFKAIKNKDINKIYNAINNLNQSEKNKLYKYMNNDKIYPNNNIFYKISIELKKLNIHYYINDIINNNNTEILLGGKIKDGENEIDTLLRELNEELNLKTIKIENNIESIDYLCFMIINDNIFDDSYYNKIVIIKLNLTLNEIKKLFRPNKEISSLIFYKLEYPYKKTNYVKFLRNIFNKN